MLRHCIHVEVKIIVFYAIMHMDDHNTEHYVVTEELDSFEQSFFNSKATA